VPGEGQRLFNPESSGVALVGKPEKGGRGNSTDRRKDVLRNELGKRRNEEREAWGLNRQRKSFSMFITRSQGRKRS